MNGIKQEREFGNMSNTSPVDPLVDSLIDFGEFDSSNLSYHSPSLSPTATSKASFSRPTPTSATTPISLLSTAQPLSGPSHDYDLYKQQTGIVPGALASTLAVNQNNAQISGYNPFNLEEFLGMSNPDNMFDFNTSPSQQTENMDVEFDSPAETSFFFDSTVNPSVIGGQESQGLPSPSAPSTTSSVGRLWPGMHQQAALAKAQAQQRQQQQIIQQQQQQQQQQKQRSQSQQHQPKHQRTKSVQPPDSMVEQKITQLLNSMRAKPASPDAQNQAPVLSLTRPRKEEDEMDEDERLLASEEGKKLSSKERRQLRNKVSARAFRSRRKEYISQLEAEIANKVTENGDLRAQNKALLDENKRLQDLTRMLLSSPSFSDFLDRLSSNPSQLSQPAPTTQQVEQRPETRQIPKDINPYAVQNQQRQQQIGMAMIPEQSMDFSMLSLDTDTSAFNYQPQVYAVLDTPEIVLPPSVDTSLLSGKSSNFVGESFDTEAEKVEAPVIKGHHLLEEKVEAPAMPVVVDEEFDNDPQFSLYHDCPSLDSEEPISVDIQGTLSSESNSNADIFGGIETAKALARYELVDAAKEEAEAALALLRLERMSARLESMMEQLERLTMGSS